MKEKVSDLRDVPYIKKTPTDEEIVRLKSLIKKDENDTLSRLRLAELQEMTGDTACAVDNYRHCAAFFASKGLLAKAYTIQMKVYSLRYNEAVDRFERLKRFKKYRHINTERLSHIYSVILFSNLSCEDIIKIYGLLQEIKVEPGAVVIEEGDMSRSLYIVVSGALKVSARSIKEDETVIAKLTKGDFFGEIGLITGKPRIATVTSMVDTVLYELKHEDLEGFSSSYPQIGDILFCYGTGRENSFLFASSEISDKRSYDRIKSRCPITFSLFSKEGKGEKGFEGKGLLSDISLGGVCITIDGWDIGCNTIGILGKTVHVTVELPYEKDKRLTLFGKVVWVKQHDAGSSINRITCGIKFAEPVTLDIDEIERLIENLLTA